jgi:hypothetical protein
MPGTPPSSPPPNQIKKAKTGVSPAQPQMFTPPVPEAQVHHHQRDGKTRDKANTPGGSTVPFPEHPGASHQVLDNSRGVRVRELDFHTTNNFDIMFDALLLSLSNLRNRANQDYSTYKKSQKKDATVVYDRNHHKTTIQKIDLALAMIKTCIMWPQHKIDVLQKLNHAIAERRIYNPLGLKRLYPDQYIYQYELAQKPWVFTTGDLTASQFDTIRLARPTPPRPPAISIAASSTSITSSESSDSLDSNASSSSDDSKKRKSPASLACNSAPMFRPRSVKKNKKPKTKIDPNLESTESNKPTNT